MTATMPPEHVDRFDYIDQIDYVDDSSRAERLRLFHPPTLIDRLSFAWFCQVQRDREAPESFQTEFAKLILSEWHHAKANRRIIAVVETVKDAAAIYKSLKEEIDIYNYTGEQFLFLYHGRIADHLRPNLYKLLKTRDGANLPYILVTTSAIEVGCDLNCEVLISQICPPENLIQRAGRCNRKGAV